MYLVTWEGVDDDGWRDAPEGFGTLVEAETYAAEMDDALLPGNCMVIYYCSLLKRVQRIPQDTTP